MHVLIIIVSLLSSLFTLVLPRQRMKRAWLWWSVPALALGYALLLYLLLYLYQVIRDWQSPAV